EQIAKIFALSFSVEFCLHTVGSSRSGVLFERGWLWWKQQRGAGGRKGGIGVRFTREGHELLGEFVPTLPRVDLRKRDLLRLGVRQRAEFVDAHGCQRRDDRQL